MKYLVVRSENLNKMKIPFPKQKMKIQHEKTYCCCVCIFPQGLFLERKKTKNMFAVCAFSRRGLLLEKKICCEQMEFSDY